jgi:HSP20 family protein
MEVMKMTITEKAKQKLDGAGKEIKDAIESLKDEVEELAQKVKEKLKGAGDEMKETAQELTQEVKNLKEKVARLMPQKKKAKGVTVQVSKAPVLFEKKRWEHPFLALQQASNRLFEEFFRDYDLTPFETRNFWDLSTKVAESDWPFVDMSETEKEVVIAAEIPGVDKNDIDISISENRITIRGEKNQQEEKAGRNYYRFERSYGSFQRSFSLPCEIETEKVDATFKEGVLHIKLPKTAKAQERIKRITVRAA